MEPIAKHQRHVGTLEDRIQQPAILQSPTNTQSIANPIVWNSSTTAEMRAMRSDTIAKLITRKGKHGTALWHSDYISSDDGQPDIDTSQLSSYSLWVSARNIGISRDDAVELVISDGSSIVATCIYECAARDIVVLRSKRSAKLHHQRRVFRTCLFAEWVNVFGFVTNSKPMADVDVTHSTNKRKISSIDVENNTFSETCSATFWHSMVSHELGSAYKFTTEYGTGRGRSSFFVLSGVPDPDTSMSGAPVVSETDGCIIGMMCASHGEFASFALNAQFIDLAVVEARKISQNMNKKK